MDLVPVSHKKKEKVSMVNSWDFGPSLMMEGTIKLLEKEKCFSVVKGQVPHGEIVSYP